MSPLRGKRVLIFQQRNWGINIGHFLAKQLKAEGCHLAALNFKPSTREFIAKQKDVVYEMIEDQDEIMARPREYLGCDQYSLAEICRELGVDSVWPLVQSLRHHVKSYADRYYYGFKQNVSDEDIVAYLEATHKSFKRIFDEFKPDIVIAPTFVTYPHIACNLYAKKRGIPMLTVTDSKVSEMYVFSYNYLDAESPFLDHLQALNRGVEQTKNRERARAYIREFREHFKKPTTLTQYKQYNKKTPVQRLRHALAPYYHILQWYLHAPQVNPEGTGITADWRPPRIILRDHYMHDWYMRKTERFPYYPIEKIGKCVYFPLQFQPEAAVDLTSPRYNNQIETARQVAMSLPDDYTLVVKDHPGMYGYRSPEDLEQLARTPNVKLVDYRIPSETILKKADLVVGPASTTLAEAAFLQKPAIQLGDLGITQQLPNVVHHNDVTTLPGVIRKILKNDLHTPEYECRLENYVAAAFDVCFDLPYADVWAGSRSDLLPALWEIYRAELERILNK
ncbi:MAG: polysialyltransferase family glycosyltransferase [bacterium]|nr:polysialyltransferase family glycosyltransferase [bacterium]